MSRMTSALSPGKPPVYITKIASFYLCLLDLRIAWLLALVVTSVVQHSSVRSCSTAASAAASSASSCCRSDGEGRAWPTPTWLRNSDESRKEVT